MEKIMSWVYANMPFLKFLENVGNPWDFVCLVALVLVAVVLVVLVIALIVGACKKGKKQGKGAKSKKGAKTAEPTMTPEQRAEQRRLRKLHVAMANLESSKKTTDDESAEVKEESAENVGPAQTEEVKAEETVAKETEPTAEETAEREAGEAPVAETVAVETVSDEEPVKAEEPAKEARKEEKDVENERLRAEVERLRAEKTSSAKATAPRTNKSGEAERLRAEIEKLKAEKAEKEKARKLEKTKKESEQLKTEIEKLKIEIELKKKQEQAVTVADNPAKAKNSGKKVSTLSQEKPRTAKTVAKPEKEEKQTDKAVGAQPVAVEKLSDEKKVSDAEVARDKKTGKFAGKWIIEIKSEDEYIAKLSANNGEVMLTSEIYSTPEGARNGIDTIVRNVNGAGKFIIYQDKNKNFYYKLKNSTNRFLCAGEIYKVREQCAKAVESVKRIVHDAIIVDEVAEGSKYIDYKPLEITEYEVKKGARGKWKVEENGDGTYSAKLYASNGQLMLSTEAVASRKTAENAIESVKKNSSAGNFIIDRDKFGRYYYKLRNAQKSVICIGEAYATLENCINALESVRKFSATAIVVTAETPVETASEDNQTTEEYRDRRII